MHLRGLLEHAHVRLLGGVHGEGHRQSPLGRQARHRDPVGNILVHARVHLILPEPSPRLLAVPFHVAVILQCAHRPVVGLEILITPVQDHVIVIDLRVIQRVVREDSPHGLHVVEVTAVGATVGVGAVGVPLAHREEDDGLALGEVGLDPLLEGRGLGAGLVVVPLVVGELQVLRGLAHVGGKDLVPILRIPVPLAVSVGLPDQVLGDPRPECQSGLLHAHGTAKSPVDVPLLAGLGPGDHTAVLGGRGGACTRGDAASGEAEGCSGKEHHGAEVSS
mmetsp:Transcript_30780/g.73821  ORF Transcript_30780/g.73821 Transcript_30780/m.73821 type:complete len:277 (+) Transcript_30780:369-1199(+)